MFDKRIPTAKANEQKKITDFIAQEVNSNGRPSCERMLRPLPTSKEAQTPK